jgi:hypothetical protein
MIATVTEDSSCFTVWDENGQWISHIDRHSGYELKGFTSTTVSIKDSSGDTLIFDESGHHIRTVR